MAHDSRQLKDIALAFVETAEASKVLPDALVSLYAVRDAFASDRGLVRAFSDSAVDEAKRRDALKQALKSQVHAYVVNALLVLQQEELLTQIDVFTSTVTSLAKEKANHRRAEVTSAIELTADERHALERTLVKKFGGTVELSTHVDSSLLGGLVVRIDDWQFDGTLKRTCKRLADTLATP
jgi:F-type H+-transporting ATPase subunit delta